MTLATHDRVYVRDPLRRGTGTVLEVRRDHTVRVCLDAGRVVRVPVDRVQRIDREPVSTTLSAGPYRTPDYSAKQTRPVPKVDKIRSPSWLAWVRKRPCEWCSAPAPSEASHHNAEGHGAMASKADDCDTLPLCHGCHVDYHRTFALGSMDAAQTRQWVQHRLNETKKAWLREHVFGEEAA